MRSRLLLVQMLLALATRNGAQRHPATTPLSVMHAQAAEATSRVSCATRSPTSPSVSSPARPGKAELVAGSACALETRHVRVGSRL